MDGRRWLADGPALLIGECQHDLNSTDDVHGCLACCGRPTGTSQVQLDHLGGLDQQCCLADLSRGVEVINDPLHQALPPESITNVVRAADGAHQVGNDLLSTGD